MKTYKIYFTKITIEEDSKSRYFDYYKKEIESDNEEDALNKLKEEVTSQHNQFSYDILEEIRIDYVKIKKPDLSKYKEF